MYLLRALVSLVGMLNARMSRAQARSLPLGMVLGVAALIGSLVLAWAMGLDAREPEPAPLTAAQVAAGTSRRFVKISGTAVYQNGVIRKAGDQFQAYYYPVLDPDVRHVLMVKSPYTIEGSPERVVVVGYLRPMDPVLLEVLKNSGPYRDVQVDTVWLLDTSFTRIPLGWGLGGTVVLGLLALILLLGSTGAWTAFAPATLRGLAGVDPLTADLPVRITGWLRHESGVEIFAHLFPATLVPEQTGLSARTALSFTWYSRAGAPTYSGTWRLDCPRGEPVSFGYIFEGFATRPAVRWRSSKRRYAYLVFDSEREAAAALHSLEETPRSA